MARGELKMAYIGTTNNQPDSVLTAERLKEAYRLVKEAEEVDLESQLRNEAMNDPELYKFLMRVYRRNR